MTPLTPQDNPSSLWAVDRSTIRNTFLYTSDDRDTQLGGVYASPGITNDNFHSMVEIICLFSDTFELCDDNGQLVGRDDKQLQPGDYYIATNGSITLTEEVPLLRTTSTLSGTRTKSFSEAVRSRDMGCILTGRSAIPGRWYGMQVAHIFPLAYEEHWNRHGYNNLITIPPNRESDGSINSVQNGILLSLEMHDFFDNYVVAINPFDDYKIVSFGPEPLYCNVRTHLNPLLRQNIGWPPDELLHWHFRQAVLTNMKGAGEPCLETDFPPGSNIMGQIMSGPMTAARMEFELFGRLGTVEGCV
ncbi:hypothetical protein HOY82DRAFT_674012 [Tuber indicum]|nr:hypothetical protein HOY82DRAFT_674012 [Tuber indicum]